MFGNSAMGKGVVLGWIQMGIRIEDIRDDTRPMRLYISVPEGSYQKDLDGIEMAGMHLARRFKKLVRVTISKDAEVLAKTRSGEYWTQELADNAETEFKRVLDHL